MSAAPVELRAGPLRLELEGADLRAIGPPGAPLVQRVYPAFRDAEWKTAPVTVAWQEVDRGEGTFACRIAGTASLGELDLGWRIRAEGWEDGTVSCNLVVEPLAEFGTRRLGLCVHLDAAACGGAEALVGGPDGEQETLGEEIAPQPVDGESFEPMLGPFTRLSLGLRDGTRVRLDTAETEFELEDQRNWADSTLKAYSTETPGVRTVRPGEVLEQEVRLSFDLRCRSESAPRARSAVVGEPGASPLAPIGVSLPGEWEPPVELSPAHLRVDVGRGAPAPDPKRLAQLIARTSAAVELAVHGGAEEPPELPSGLSGLPLARVLALELDERSTSPELARLVRHGVGAKAPLAVGTSAHFSEVCRRPPSAARAEQLCWSAHPQVHARDERSVIENLPGLGAQVRTALALLPALEPLVTTLSLGPPGEPEPRARAPFGGAWAVGALAELLGAGVASVTMAGGPGQEEVLAVAAVAMEARGEPLRPVAGLDRGLAALAWGEGQAEGLLANLTAAQRSCSLQVPGAGTLELSLGPYEWVRLSSCL